MSFAADASILHVADLTAADDSQLVRYLKSHGSASGGYDISSAAGLEKLSKSQRDEVGPSTVDNTTAPISLDIDTLLTRLTCLSDYGPDGSSRRAPLRQRHEAAATTSDRSTPPDTTIEDLVTGDYQELIQDGGRPICRIESLFDSLAAPGASCDALRPWLDDPGSSSRDQDIQAVYSRQLARWWDFRKWQWNTHGIHGDGAFSAFLEASKSRYERIGAYDRVSDPRFESEVRWQWAQKPVSRRWSFPTYTAVVRRKLAPHHFVRTFRLKKNPRHQDQWSTWLEYLVYEYLLFERLNDFVESEERRHSQAWERLLEAMPLSARQRRESLDKPGNSHLTEATINLDVSQPSNTRQRHSSRQTAALKEQLAAARADAAAIKTTLEDFIRETAPYRRAKESADRQRRRVNWVVEEARVMEAEMKAEEKAERSHQRGLSKTSGRGEAGSKKRKLGVEEDLPNESWAKRTRHGQKVQESC
ncbi:MAG: hypothetical protein M1817_000833 [Caeruleum heppii]|nr:MAG: hypothetical protein M1817_000833 [Caeruleum heppii]